MFAFAEIKKVSLTAWPDNGREWLSVSESFSYLAYALRPTVELECVAVLVG